MIGAIFQALGTSITQFAQVVGNGVSGIISLFWSGEALTDLGNLCLVGVGVGLVFWAYRLVRGLMRVR